MSEGNTGDSPFSGGGTSGIISNTHVQDARCENYDTRYRKSGSSDRETIRPHDALPGELPVSAIDKASARLSIQQFSKVARDAASRLESAVREEDFMEAVMAGEALKNSLEEVWKLRSHREPEFGEIVNMLQLTLAKTEFEQLAYDQCLAIGKVVNHCLFAGATDETEVREARQLLREGGFNPWRGLTFRAEG